ncbi:MAG TPA: type II toxin-antitoxin system VapC family toxin [Bacteroidia bacterium]|nr:type II toxin-antitoxin system VapC family toxin [Bacteroidia bacterium]
MNGNNFLLDTNIVLYLLGGDEVLAEILQGKQIYISFITELELYSFRNLSPSEKAKIDLFIEESIVIDINSEIKKTVVNIRSEKNLKLPDTIIAATSLFLSIPLITSDKGFMDTKNLDLVLYTN